ncbi:MAG: flagellar biosynthetic protein FliO [Negativicutes bacterium]|nr:flagellar biosynthetic protein FliO [Negativicutes bacterium]
MLRHIYSVLLFLIILLLLSGLAAAASNEYLKYQEPQPAASSAFSTIAYVISLIVTFSAVIGLAYFTSKYLGQRMGTLGTAGDNRILVTVPLGPNKAVFIVEVAGKVLVLGVTDHSINLLQEVTAAEEIQKLKQLTPARSPQTAFEQIFDRHIASLQQMSQKFPAVFGPTNAERDKEEKR